MTFLAPLLVAGTLLASVPIIIHLLNRRQYKLLEWAPMHYLKLSIQTTRRRLQIEQWILLAIRTLVVLALFLAVARPVISASGIGAWISGSNRVSRVIIIDDSLSMDYRTGGVSAMQRARDVATALVNKLGAKDSVTVVRTSNPDEPLVRQASLEDPALLLAEVAGLEATSTGSNWAQSLSAARNYLDELPFPIQEITLITDLRQHGWSEQVTELSDELAEQGVDLRIIDVGRESTGNAALISLSMRQPIALAGGDTQLIAEIRNDGEQSLSEPQARLTVDDRTTTITLPDIEPGKSVQVPLAARFSEPGPHAVSLTLDDDAMPADNTGHLAVDVRRTLEVQLVDGQPGIESLDSETYFLLGACELGAPPWQVKVVTDAEWATSPLGAPDVLVLANVATLSSQRATELRAMVEAGMGLIIFPGEQVDLRIWNETLYEGAAPLLPAKLDRVNLEPEATGLLVESLADSPIGVLGKLRPSVLEQIAPRQTLNVSLPSDPAESGVRVLARWNDPTQSPAVLEKRIGNGRVLLWTVTADRGWSDWPIQPSYVLAVREAALNIAGGSREPNNVVAGEPLMQPISAERPPTGARVQPPGESEAIKLAAARDQATETDELLLRFDQTQQAGVYELMWTEPLRGNRSRLYAVNPPAEESELRRIAPDALRGMLGNVKMTLIRTDGNAQVNAEQGTELWRTLALAMLALLGVETMLATWIDRDR